MENLNFTTDENIKNIQNKKESFDFLIEKYQIRMPKVLVFGVGGGGSQCVEKMYKDKLENVDFVIANTDINDLACRVVPRKILLGRTIANGLGAGRDTEVGRKAAEESLGEIEEVLEDVSMVFITAYMSGGTGTGAAPVIAKKAKEMGILVAVMITKPSKTELPLNTKIANDGIEELKKYADTIVVIPMDNLIRVVNFETRMVDAYAKVVDVIASGVKSITDLITKHGHINLDFADIRTNMRKIGRAMMGTGEASGENRAVKAVEEAINNPLLDNVSIRGTKGIIVNITSSENINFLEIEDCLNRIKGEIGECSDTLMIFGNIFDENMGDRLRVSIFATGIGQDDIDDKKIVVDRNKNVKIEYRQQTVEKTYVLTEKKEIENEGEKEIVSKIERITDVAKPVETTNNVAENVIKKQVIRRKIGEEIEEEGLKEVVRTTEKIEEEKENGEVFDIEETSGYVNRKNILNNRVMSIEEQYKLLNRKENGDSTEQDYDPGTRVVDNSYSKLLKSHKEKESKKKVGFFGGLFSSKKKDKGTPYEEHNSFSDITKLDDYDDLTSMIEVNTYDMPPYLKKRKEEE